ncbi:hypothetical protein CPB83DRAFT_367766 [Crepidotus variabilis]|uniref:DUF6534 domain-containing protein n=1 Tax=Crepidotus variabilis TaxID=179855 RepID=A0A9P6EFL5_9AGAR|nr:hypothetical protein CPB83DRAFT_367766 [Crepidotus variabilis]
MMSRPEFSPAGAFLVGTFLNGILFGVLCVQTYMYYLAFPKDRPTVKGLVYVVFLIEIAETILFMAGSYHMIADGWGDNTVFTSRQVIWVMPLTSSIGTQSLLTLHGLPLTFLTLLVISAVQCYYAYCIKLISRTWMISVVIIAGSAVQLGAGMAKAQYWFTNGIGSPGVEGKIEDSIWHGASVFCDIIIASCMTYFLRKNFSDLSWTKRPVKRIIRLTIETGVVITVFTIICTGLRIGLETSYHVNYHRVFIAIIGKLYANSLLVLINSRIDLQHESPRRVSYAPTSILNTYGSPPNTPARDVMLADFQRSHITSGHTETAYGTQDIISTKGSELV